MILHMYIIHLGYPLPCIHFCLPPGPISLYIPSSYQSSTYSWHSCISGFIVRPIWLSQGHLCDNHLRLSIGTCWGSPVSGSMSLSIGNSSAMRDKASEFPLNPCLPVYGCYKLMIAMQCIIQIMAFHILYCYLPALTVFLPLFHKKFQVLEEI